MSIDPKTAREFTSPEALKNYLSKHPGADRSKHNVKKDDGGGGKKKEEQHSSHTMRDKAEEHTKSGRHDEAALAYMGAAHKFREKGDHAAAKSMDEAAQASAKKHLKKKSSDLKAVNAFKEALLVRNVVARAIAP